MLQQMKLWSIPCASVIHHQRFQSNVGQMLVRLKHMKTQFFTNRTTPLHMGLHSVIANLATTHDFTYTFQFISSKLFDLEKQLASACSVQCCQISCWFEMSGYFESRTLALNHPKIPFSTTLMHGEWRRHLNYWS